MGHAFIAATQDRCRILSICSHPENPRIREMTGPEA
jgi:hypothetical protein